LLEIVTHARKSVSNKNTSEVMADEVGKSASLSIIAYSFSPERHSLNLQKKLTLIPKKLFPENTHTIALLAITT